MPFLLDFVFLSSSGVGRRAFLPVPEERFHGLSVEVRITGDG
jgi:hypothetical protein